MAEPAEKKQKMALEGAAIVGQSGGPTVVINSSLVGYIMGCKAAGNVTKIYGMRHGIKGLLAEDIVDLGKESDETLEKIRSVPAAALGSVRMKVTKDDFAAMVPILKKYNIKFFFYIGGNDSAETAHLTNTVAAEAGASTLPAESERLNRGAPVRNRLLRGSEQRFWCQ